MAGNGIKGPSLQVSSDNRNNPTDLWGPFCNLVFNPMTFRKGIKDIGSFTPNFTVDLSY